MLASSSAIISTCLWLNTFSSQHPSRPLEAQEPVSGALSLFTTSLTRRPSRTRGPRQAGRPAYPARRAFERSAPCTCRGLDIPRSEHQRWSCLRNAPVADPSPGMPGRSTQMFLQDTHKRQPAVAESSVKPAPQRQAFRESAIDRSNKSSQGSHSSKLRSSLLVNPALHYVSIPLTTCQCTSVSRKSRPE